MHTWGCGRVAAVPKKMEKSKAGGSNAPLSRAGREITRTHTEPIGNRQHPWGRTNRCQTRGTFDRFLSLYMNIHSRAHERERVQDHWRPFFIHIFQARVRRSNTVERPVCVWARYESISNGACSFCVYEHILSSFVWACVNARIGELPYRSGFRAYIPSIRSLAHSPTRSISLSLFAFFFYILYPNARTRYNENHTHKPTMSLGRARAWADKAPCGFCTYMCFFFGRVWIGGKKGMFKLTSCFSVFIFY